MKNRLAVYAASLDPITNGHIDIIERTAPLYDELIVLVAVDSRKNYTFSSEERVAMAKNAVAKFPNVTVDMCIGQYVVSKAKNLGAQVVIRGLRNVADLEFELGLAEENRKISPEIQTIWVPCKPSLMFVSSSMVKGHVGADPDWERQVARSAPSAVVIKLKEKYIQSKARKHWDLLMASLENPKGSNAVFNDLLLRYSDPPRAYHNLEHIVSMLDELHLVSGHNQAVALAIWFHDVVYDPCSSNNEMLSAVFAESIIHRLGLSKTLNDSVCRLITATKHDIVPPTDYDSQLIVDLDLMILGKSEEKFDAYEAGIREEYDWAPEKDFRLCRAKVLQSFLDRPSIFTREDFWKKYEASARKNLKRSIEKLKG